MLQVTEDDIQHGCHSIKCTFNGLSDDFTLVGHSELKAFVADANEAVNFKLLRNYQEKGDEDKPNSTKEEPFNPEMTHQVYGDT